MLAVHRDAWDRHDEEARYLDALKALERASRSPSRLDADSVERWRLYRECISELLVRALRRERVH